MNISTTTKRKRGRPRSRKLTSDGDIGTLQAVAKYLKLSPGYLYDMHRAAKRRAELGRQSATPNPSFVKGGKTSGEWFKAWLERNPDAVPERGVGE